MTKRTARRAPQRANPNLVVYILAGILLLIVGALAFNVLSGGQPRQLQWSEPPPMTIDTGAAYYATIETEKGNIDLVLFPQAAPQAVNSFIFLAEQGYYDGVTFHRVIPGFMAQGGDPTGSGTGGPGYTFGNETDAGLLFDSEGVLAMANTGQPNSNGSQFFITYAPQPGLDGGYTIFGRVLAGMDVVTALTPRDPASNPSAPPGDAIRTISISTQPPGG
jgi:cyclophilin family peptidyl-prolyl cis-trans isomerase